jgi:hypothetical protein
MQLRDAIAPEPDLQSARRIGIAVGITVMVVFTGGAIAALHVDREPPLPDVSNDLPPSLRPLPPAPGVWTANQIALARRELAGYALETYPQWVAGSLDGGCPRHLLELNAFDVTLHAVDPWGSPYQFACAPTFWVRSAGPDRVSETDDDLTVTR